MSNPVDASVTTQGRRLTLSGPDLERHFAALWLRERAPDSETLDTQTGQRLIEAAELPLDLTLESAAIDGETLHLAFSDGHRTAFALPALLAEGRPPGSRRAARPATSMNCGMPA